MKFMIEQQKFKDILDYVQLGGIFPFVPLTTKKGQTFMESIQETEDHSIFRYAKFGKEYFKSLTSEDETIYFEADKVHNLISAEDPKTVITVCTENQRLIIDGKYAHIVLNLVDSSVGGLSKIPFKMENGVPHLQKGKVPLENHVSMGLKSFKQTIEYAKKLDTEFFRMELNKDQEFTIKVGDLEAHAEFVEFTPNVQVIEYKTPVKLTLTQGIKEIAETMSDNVGMRFKTGFPVWFYEKSQKHKFGALIALHTEGDDK